MACTGYCLAVRLLVSVRRRAGGGRSRALARLRAGVVVLFSSVVALFALAANAQGAQTLRVGIGDAGLGAVTSQPAGINCPSTCAATFPENTEVVLTAVPAPGYRLGPPDNVGDGGWGSACSVASDAPYVCRVTISADREAFITASFYPAAYLQVLPVGRGSVIAAIAAAGVGETATRTCGGADFGIAPMCIFRYLPGRSVTLTATPNATGRTFGAWSDDRCPSGPVCTLVVDAEGQSAAALFSPQLLTVRLAGSGGGTVTSSPEGIKCATLTGELRECDGYFPLFTEVELTAMGPQPVRWNGCDSDVDRSCYATMNRPRITGVGLDSIPPLVSGFRLFVTFSVGRAGTGSGTIHIAPSGRECGRRCTVDHLFGSTISLVADPDPGSHFERWRGACSSQPTCQLAIGPVTRVTGVFERDSASSQSPSPPSSPALPPPDLGLFREPSTRLSGGPSMTRPFVANLLRLVVRGHGRTRAIVLRLRVNAAAQVRATLTAHRRDVTRNWRMARGSGVLKWRIPVRVRAGRYRTRIVVRRVGGPSKRFIRLVRLPR
jgi:hypothetical protein